MTLDRTNQRFGRLTVLGPAARDTRGPMWHCVCDCGQEVNIPSRQLAGKRPTQSCGCLQREKAAITGSASFKDRTGEKTGRLTILSLAGSRNGRPAWKCRCECGREIEARGSDLYLGRTQSCGCLQAERAAEANVRRTKHGHARQGANNTRKTSPEYRSWKAMLERVRNPSAPNYHLYGGRGIKICDRWMGEGGFVNFYADMGERPDGQTLDRINTDGDYTPENCRWADAKTQARNRRETPEYAAARKAALDRGRLTMARNAKRRRQKET